VDNIFLIKKGKESRKGDNWLLAPFAVPLLDKHHGQFGLGAKMALFKNLSRCSYTYTNVLHVTLWHYLPLASRRRVQFETNAPTPSQRTGRTPLPRLASAAACLLLPPLEKEHARIPLE